MAREKCFRCERATSDVKWHAGDHWLCKLCGDYNDDCVTKGVIAESPTFEATHVLNCPGTRSQDSANDHTILTASTAADTQGATAGTTTISTDTTPTVKTLEELLTVDKPAEAYVKSVSVIHMYNSNNIKATLEKLTMETLRSLYNLLWQQMMDKFTMKDCRPKMRQAKHTIILDIYHFGMSLANGILSKETEKVYQVKDPSPLLNLQGTLTDKDSEMEKLLKLVMDIQSKHIKFEKEMNEMKKENAKRVKTEADLRQEITELRAQLNVQAPNNTAPVEEDNSPQEPVPVEDDMPAQDIAEVEHSNDSSGDSESDEDEHSFQPPASYIKKLRRLEKKVKQLSTPPVAPQSTTTGDNTTNETQQQLTAGADNNRGRNQPQGWKSSKTPSGQKDLYIGGAPFVNNADDLKVYFKSQGIHNIGDITPLSRKDDWLSFKVSLPSKDFNHAMTSKGWHTGVRIRPFRDSPRPYTGGSRPKYSSGPKPSRPGNASGGYNPSSYNEWPLPGQQDGRLSWNRLRGNQQQQHKNTWNSSNQRDRYYDSYDDYSY